VRQVETRLISLREPELASARVGEAVMRVLREVDPVAYVRFASVYGEFESVQQFAEAIVQLQEQAK